MARVAAPATLIEGFEVLVRARNSTGIFCGNVVTPKSAGAESVAACAGATRPRDLVHVSVSVIQSLVFMTLTCFSKSLATRHQAPGKLRANTIVR